MRLAMAMAMAMAALVAGACGDSGGSGLAADTVDAAPDAGPGLPDAEPDAGPDAGPGVGPDAGPDAGPEGLPEALPFELTRPQVGEPLTDMEISAFTTTMTSLWTSIGYVDWLSWTCHGVHPSNPDGLRDYALWWQDTQAYMEGDTVRFAHTGGADNLALRTAKVLNNLLAGHLLTGDAQMGEVAAMLAKGFVALSLGMEWGDEDPLVRYLQARAIFTVDHSFALSDGRQVAVDYGPVKTPKDDWNAATVNNPDNPHWGDIWVRNQRSKDDVPHMYRSVPMLMRAIAESPDPDLVAACSEALEHLVGFAKDIVDSGYQIRTKGADGVAHVPVTESGAIKDLASFVLFDDFVPHGECNAKLGSALIATGGPLEHECGPGDGGFYEEAATTTHYFNYAIIRFFHVAAAYNALTFGQPDQARALLEGLIARADRVMHDETLPHFEDPVWWPDVAAFLVAAAAAGLPLTHEEARLVRDQYTLSADHYAQFPSWDPWAAGLPDGPFDYKPPRGTAVRPTELMHLLEYCYSPLRNPAGAPLVDCEALADIASW